MAEQPIYDDQNKPKGSLGQSLPPQSESQGTLGQNVGQGRLSNDYEKAKKAYDSIKRKTGYGKEALEELAKNAGMTEKNFEEMLEQAGMNKEEAAAAAHAIMHKKGGGSLFKKDDDSKKFGKTRKAYKRIKRIRWFFNYKLVIGVAVLAGLLLLLLFVGTLKLPDVMEGIESYEFASVSNQFFKDATNVTSEDLSVEASADTKGGVFDQLKAYYGNLKDEMWTKVLGDSPDKVLANMADDNGLQLRFRTSKLTGRRIFTGGSINGDSFEVDPPSGIGAWTPGIRQYLKFKNQQAFYDSGFMDVLSEEMKADEIAPIVRGVIFLKVLYASGGSLSGWILNKFIGNSDEDNVITATQQQYQAQKAGMSEEDNSVMPEVQAAETAGETTEDAAANSAKQTGEAIADGGVLPSVQAAINSALSGGLLTSILHFTGFIWAVVAPICIIYDGSVVQSGPSIANQMNEVENAFDQLAAEADQQKNGDVTSTDDGELANAVGGTNTEIGDISTSVPYQRAYGLPQATDFIPSVEAGADGSYQYSLLNVLGVSATSPLGKAANGVATSFCKAFTSIWASVGLTLAQIVAALLTFGAEPAAADAAGRTATEFITDFVYQSWLKIFGKKIINGVITQTEEGFMARAVKFILVQGTILTTTLGLTYLAHMEVLSRSGIANDGLAQGDNLVDMADDGANIEAGELQREELFGRPLLANEVSQLETSDTNEVDYANSQKSFTQRYFALSNYDSLATHIGMDLGAADHASIFASIFSLGSALLTPMRSLASLISTFASPTAFAAADPTDYDYGNVQFGWSVAENNLIASSVTYMPLENQKILDDASDMDGMSRADAIAQKYAICFGYQYNPSGNVNDLDPNDAGGGLQTDPTATVSDLLTSDPPYIVRDGTTGDVINGGGLCDPDNLSYDSSDPLAADAQTPELNGKKSPQANDMIFRWRLALAYDTTADQLISEGVINDSGE